MPREAGRAGALLPQMIPAYAVTRCRAEPAAPQSVSLQCAPAQL